MNDTFRILLFVGAYVVLMRWVLPRFGIRTCLSGQCGVIPRTGHSPENENAPGQSTAPAHEK
jgi:hypothetical protein